MTQIDPDKPLIRSGRLAGTSSVVIPAVESGSFSRHGRRDDTSDLFVGRYSNFHGDQFAKIRFPDLLADLRIYSCGERLLLRNLHCYSRHGLTLQIHAGIGEISPKRLDSVEYVTKHPWRVVGGVEWVDITRVTMPSSNVLALSAPDRNPNNYGSFRGASGAIPPMVELTIPGSLAYAARLLDDLWKVDPHG